MSAGATIPTTISAENNPPGGMQPLPTSPTISPLALAGAGSINDGNDAVRDFYRLNLLAVG